MKKEIIVNGSLSCIDLLHIQDQMNEINNSSIDGLHYDVVDGEFNNCFVFGDLILEKIRPLTKKSICVHLAVNQVEKYLEPMIKAGADCIAIHFEAECNHQKIFSKIRELGAKPVLAFRSETEVPNNFIDLAKQVEWILKLTVNPGYSGQKIQNNAFNHIKKMRKMLDEAHLNIDIEADGNVNLETIPLLAKAGASIFTGGTSGLFNKNGTMEENYQKMKEAFEYE